MFHFLGGHSLEHVFQVAIMNQGKVLDECVGRTFIDMEDRFFNPKVAMMVEQEITPIELRYCAMKCCGRFKGRCLLSKELNVG